MKLPDSDRLLVERVKIADYLLDPAHPGNGGKAAFFASLGFDSAIWETLAEALRTLGSTCEVAHSMESKHGWKYIVDGTISSPAGKRARVRTIWILEKLSKSPRLVTAYPLDK